MERIAKGISRVVFWFVAIAVFATGIASAQPTWLFGRHAVIDWTPNPVSQRLWADTSQTAPGILWDGRGRPILYKIESGLNLNAEGDYETEFGVKWFGGDSIACNLRTGNDRVLSMGGIPDAIIVRKPGSRDTVYTIQCHQNSAQPVDRWETIENGALTANIVDLSMNDGQGFVFVATDTIVKAFAKPGGTGLQLAKRQAASAQTLVPHANGRDLWLIVPLVYPYEIRTFRITPSGIDTNALLTDFSFRRTYRDTGQDAGQREDPLQDYIGELKVSVDGRKFAFCAGSMGRIGLFDFDNSTGIISNEREISDSSIWRSDDTIEERRKAFATTPYGLEFSPDGRFIYITNIQCRGIGLFPRTMDVVLDSLRGELVQLDITKPTAKEIKDSRTVIVPMSYSNWFGGLQLGPDGKIYVAQRERDYISVIENPNAKGLACSFKNEAVKLAPGSICGEGFPFIMSTTLGAKPFVISQDVCLGDTAFISLGGSFVTDSVVWDFGDAFTSINTGYGRIGKHLYRQPGAYYVTATIFTGSDPQPPVSGWVYVHEMPVASAVTQRPVACKGDTVTLISSGGSYAWWYQGDSLIGQGQKHVYRADSTVTLRVVVANAYGCSDTTMLIVNVVPAPVVTLKADTNICLGQWVTVVAEYSGRMPGDSLEWSSSPPVWFQEIRGDTFASQPVEKTTYEVRLINSIGCVAVSSITVIPRNIPVVLASNDTVVCARVAVPLSARGATTYEWATIGGVQVGTGPTIVVSPTTTTTYIVAGTSQYGCVDTDTVQVSVLPGPALQISGDTVSCDGSPVTLNCTGAPAGTEQSITWLDDSGNTVGTGPTITVVPSISTFYRVASGGGAGCNDTARHYVHVGSRPVVTITPSDTIVCAGDTVIARSSGGIVMTLVVQLGVQQYSITESDSVGCSTTATATLRGITPNAISAALRDTTVDISNGATTLHVNIISPQQFVGTTLGSIVLRVTHQTRSIKIDRFIDARTGATLPPSMQSNVGDRSQFEVTVPTTSLTSTTEPLLNIEGLPLIDDDSTSNVDVQILSIAGLGACTDSSSKGGLLTITGCGRGYVSGLRVGSALSVKAYPNPTSDNLTVAVDVGMIGAITIDLIDALGQRVMSNTTTRSTSSRSIDTHRIDMQSIPAGTYRVVVSTPVEVRTVGVVRR